MKIGRKWAMPNKNTFSIKPIKELVEGLQNECLGVSVDPFSGESRIANYCNDLDPDKKCEYRMDALSFLQLFEDQSVGLVFFDPPYSPRQVSECYKKVGETVNMETTQSSFWSRMKREISRVVVPKGKVLTCGWCSNGIGKSNGFEIEEILLVAHGGWHNDTICTVERKVR